MEEDIVSARFEIIEDNRKILRVITSNEEIVLEHNSKGWMYGYIMELANNGLITIEEPE